MSRSILVTGLVALVCVVTAPEFVIAEDETTAAENVGSADLDQTSYEQRTFARDGVKADNTKNNRRDAEGDTLTPFDQSNDQKALDVTATIRRAIVGNDKFSSYARNIKIITTNDGKVALRGPVRTAEEKDQIVDLAERTAPDLQVINQLEIITK